MPGFTTRGHGCLRMTEGPQVRFLKEDENYCNGEIGNNYSNYAKSGTSTAKESNVNDDSKYLQGKYGYMNTGTISMQGVPTTVSVSGAFLKKCMNDPEKAKDLEENLAALPDCASYAVSHAQGTLTSISYEIDANGNITGISSGTNDPDGKIARENLCTPFRRGAKTICPCRGLFGRR